MSKKKAAGNQVGQVPSPSLLFATWKVPGGQVLGWMQWCLKLLVFLVFHSSTYVYTWRIVFFCSQEERST